MTPELISVNTAIDQMLLEVKDGWASPELTHSMAALIEQTHPHLCVEIGVFAGRSLFTQAIAMREFGGGMIVGIDPWQRAATVEGGVGAENSAWWSSVELHKIHNEFMDHLWRLGLEKRCIIMRSASEDCCEMFTTQTIDVIYLDGNHSEEVSCRDVTMWLPKVRNNGHIWFDDCGWSTTQKAQGILSEYCDFILQSDQAKLFRRR